MWRSLALVGLMLAGVLPPSAGAQEAGSEARRDPVVTMFDNFFISLVAARRCSEPDERTMTMFVNNMLRVQAVAVAHYKTLMPGSTDEQIHALMNERVEKLDTVVNGAIQAQGCTHPEIVKLVESFTVNANMQFGRPAPPR